jgi:hypothetical protein
LTVRGPARLTGVGNYALRVRPSRGPGLAAALYFLDSNSYDRLGIGQYAWIAHDQIAWYRETSRRLRRAYRGPAEKLRLTEAEAVEDPAESERPFAAMSDSLPGNHAVETPPAPHLAGECRPRGCPNHSDPK